MVAMGFEGAIFGPFALGGLVTIYEIFRSTLDGALASGQLRTHSVVHSATQ
jgi:hypothetical protein